MARPPPIRKPIASAGEPRPPSAPADRAASPSSEMRPSQGDAALRGDIHSELFELATLAYATLDRRGVIETANLAFARLFDRPRGDILGLNLTKLTPPRERVALTELLTDAIDGDRKLAREMVLRGAGAGAIHARVEAVGVGRGSRRRVLVALFDTTERARLEAELGRSTRLQEIGRLTAEVAHDFSNLLLGIVGCADLALDELGAGAGARAHVEDVKAAALRGVKLTGKLLDAGRADDAPPEHAEIVTAVRQCEPVLRGLLGERVVLTVRAPSLYLPVGVPQVEIEQILLNLAMNARRAIGERGKLTIDVAAMDVDARESLAARRLRPGRYVLVKVTDDGAGMDAATQERAFEPFFSGSRGGFGLGLATVRAIVDRRGGHIDLESELGRGTSISMLLPIADEPESPRSGPGVTLVPPSSSPMSSQSPASLDSEVTVLVVEDDEMSRRAMSLFLERHGYRVLSAANGVQAMRLCAGGVSRLDVIVADLGLDGTTGDRLAAALRSMHRRAYVIHVSGRPETDPAVKRALRASRTAFLRKPFELSDLVRQIDTLVLRRPPSAKRSGAEPQEA